MTLFKKANTALEAFKFSGEMLTRSYHGWEYYFYTHQDDPYPKASRDHIEEARKAYGDAIITVVASGRSNEDAISAADLTCGDVLLKLWNDFVSSGDAAHRHNKKILKAEAMRRQMAQQRESAPKEDIKPNRGFKSEVDDRVPIWFGVAAISICVMAVMFFVNAAAP